jgi:Peptidase family S41
MRTTKAIRYAGIVLGASLALLGAPLAQARPGDPRFDAATVRADFDDLYRRLRAAHFNLYARVPRADYDRLHAAMRRAIRRPESRFEVARRFQRFVAFGRVAHARIDAAYGAYEAYLADGGRAFPLTLRISGDRALVRVARGGGGAVAAGDEVIALDGRPIASWLGRARHNLSADSDYMASALMELDLPMLLWLEMGPAARFDLALRKPDGRLSLVSLPARTREEMRAAGRAAAPGLDLAADDRTARILPGNIAYLRPGAFYNATPGASDPYDNSGFRQFIDESFERFLVVGAERLIIDLRDNPGGDSSFSDLMIGWFATRPYRFNAAFRIRASAEATASNRRRITAAAERPDPVSARFAALYAAARPGAIVDFDTPVSRPREGPRFAGRVYVLINRNSYSNAVAVAATIQDYRFGTILGEETSDLATTYGAMETFTLPRTGIRVGFPKAQIVRPSGDLAPRGVVPDIAIATPLIEGADDPVLRRAVEIVAGDQTSWRPLVSPRPLLLSRD